MTTTINADTLPAPMVPADIDLRGTTWMPLLGARLFNSDFELHATDAEFRRGLRLWWAAWHQVPAGSLPDSDRAQAKLAGFEDESSPTWKKVKKRALDGFVLCSDGRLYHPVIAEQAVKLWAARHQHDEGYRRFRDQVLARDGHACVYCGQTDAPLQLDHVVPRSRGGSGLPSNLATACGPCNQAKGAKTPSEWKR